MMNSQIQTKLYLLDTNSYFRLAKPLHPLLKSSFGNKIKHYLYLNNEFEKEFKESCRLQNKFQIYNKSIYIENRKNQLTPSKKEIKQIESLVDNLAFLTKLIPNGHLISIPDIKCLAFANIKSCIVITDDINMTALAKTVNISCIKTIDILKIMVECNHINKEKVRIIFVWWKNFKDTPDSFRNLCYFYKDCFNEILSY